MFIRYNFPSQTTDSPAYFLLSKNAKSNLITRDTAEWDAKVEKPLAVVRRYWLYSISTSLDTSEIILDISRWIRTQNTRWKSTAVVQPHFHVICMHNREMISPSIQSRRENIRHYVHPMMDLFRSRDKSNRCDSVFQSVYKCYLIKCQNIFLIRKLNNYFLQKLRKDLNFN